MKHRLRSASIGISDSVPNCPGQEMDDSLRLPTGFKWEYAFDIITMQYSSFHKDEALVGLFLEDTGMTEITF